MLPADVGADAGRPCLVQRVLLPPYPFVRVPLTCAVPSTPAEGIAVTGLLAPRALSDREGEATASGRKAVPIPPLAVYRGDAERPDAAIPVEDDELVPYEEDGHPSVVQEKVVLFLRLVLLAFPRRPIPDHGALARNVRLLRGRDATPLGRPTVAAVYAVEVLPQTSYWAVSYNEVRRLRFCRIAVRTTDVSCYSATCSVKSRFSTSCFCVRHFRALWP